MNTWWKVALIPGRAFALALGLLLVGCPGGLDDPDRFLGNGGGMLCPTAMDVETDIFQMKCAGQGCHPSESPAAGLDLVSPGIVARLATQTTVNQACVGDPLVDMNDARAGSLYKKVAGSECGFQMPLGGMLSQEEIDCIERWIDESF